MEHRTSTFKVLLTVFVFGFVIWLGGTMFRTTIAYNLFEISPLMELKPEYTNMERMNTIYIFAVTSLMTGIAYCFTLVSSIVLAHMTRKEFRERGWLFIAFVLFIITAPIQCYFVYLDYHLSDAVYYRKIIDFYHPAIQQFFVQRFQNVTNSSLRTIVLIANFTTMLYAIWRPLETKKHK